MEALTILQVIGTVVSLGDTVVSCIAQLSSFKAQYHDAPIIVTAMIGQLHMVKLAQDQLSSIIASCSNDEPRHQDLAIQIGNALSCFSPVIMALERQMDNHNVTDGSQMSVRSRIGFLQDEREMTNLSMLLDRQVNALNLLLQAFHCQTWAQQQGFLLRSESRSILKLAEDCSSSLAGLDDIGSIITDNTDETTTRFEFDATLRSTVLYRVAERTYARLAVRGRKRRKSGALLGSGQTSDTSSEQTESTAIRSGRDIARSGGVKVVRTVVFEDSLYNRDNKSLNENPMASPAPPKGFDATAKSLKVILVGASGSGKTTLLNAMQLCDGTVEPTEYEKKHLRTLVWSNVLDSVTRVLDAMEDLGINPERPAEYQNTLSLLRQGLCDLSFNDLSSSRIMQEAKAIFSLWFDDGVQMALKRQTEYDYHDNTVYFIKNVHDIAQKLTETTTSPHQTDVLRTRVRTTGIHQTKLTRNGIEIRLYDMGGRRSERKKWIHAFEEHPTVVYPFDINAYERILHEDHNGLTINEHFMLLESLLNSNWFTNSYFIFVFTKMDLLDITSLNTFYSEPHQQRIPESQLPIQDAEEYASFLEGLIRKLVKNPDLQKRICFTCVNLVDVENHNPAEDILDMILGLTLGYEKKQRKSRLAIKEKLPTINENNESEGVTLDIDRYYQPR
ncbi:G-protein alpha subunit-domain-containing protein [Xylariaceae sp. FL0255]|nr:G-protein alpha subunit-domain-containing protein [Xylariaceae sp. FL0255]